MTPKEILAVLEKWQQLVTDAQDDTGPGGEYTDGEAHRITRAAISFANSGAFFETLSTLRGLLPVPGAPYRITIELFEDEEKKPTYIRCVHVAKPGGCIHVSSNRQITNMYSAGIEEPIRRTLSEERLDVQAVLDPCGREEYYLEVKDGTKPATN